jgi:4-amino-4-deoxy-L-arabinose transferase-like glycosyltransferase
MIQWVDISLLLTALAYLGFICLAVLCRKELLAPFKDKKMSLVLIAILACGLAIRMLVIPHYYHMWTDEAVYIHTASGILENFSAGSYARSMGWPVLLSTVFLLFGVSSKVAFMTSALLGALTAAIAYAIAVKLIKSTKLALISATVITLLPMHLDWSGSAETNIPSVFFVSLSMLCLLIFMECGTQKAFWLVCLSFSIAFLYRPENYIFIVMLIFALASRIQSYLKPGFILPLSALIVLTLPNFIINLLHSASNLEGQIIYEGRIFNGFTEIFKFLIYPNIARPLSLNLLLAAMLLFSIAGSILFFRQNKRHFYFIMLWLGCVFFYSCLFFEAHERTGCVDRLYLGFIMPIAILLAYVPSIKKGKLSVFIALAVVSSVLTYCILDLPRVISANPDQKLMMQITEEINSDVPENCVLISWQPEIFLNTAFTTVKPSVFTYRNEQCVYFLREIKCSYVNTPERESCDMTYNKYNWRLEKSYMNGIYSYALYRLIPPVSADI